MISGVFSRACFPQLEYLRMCNFKQTERNMARISSCISNLKALYIIGPFETNFKVGAFKLFVDSQRHLKKITVHDCFKFGIDRSEESALKALRELLKIFRKTRYLKFVMTCSLGKRVKKEDLIQISKILTCRGVGVHLQIMSTIYAYEKRYNRK